MDKKHQAVLNRYLKKLCLSTIRQQYQELAQQAVSESASYEQYLFNIVQQEWESRRFKRIERRLKESRLPIEKTIESFDLKRLPVKVAQQVKTLRNGEFLDNNENLLIFGNPGSGKTHLVSALAQELIRKDKRIYFSTCALLLQELLLAKKELRLPRLFKKLALSQNLWVKR
jgi:DNA replication protein DnaC